MKNEQIKQLLDRYLEGKTTLGEESELRSRFEQDDLPEELQSWKALFEYHRRMKATRTSPEFDPFSRIGSGEEEDDGRKPAGTVEWYRWSLRVAAGIILLLTGFTAGLLLDRQSAVSEEVATLQQEVDRMKQVLTNGYQQQSSASERISMISTSASLRGDDRQIGLEVTDILIYTMNNDPSVNVRMAAADALFRYRDQSHVREAMVRSLPRQNEPVMQIHLISMLVEMSEKRAISEMQKMLVDTDTREVVRPLLETGIAELKMI